MRNPDVETILNDCLSDLINVETIIEGNRLSPSVRYLTAYALIKACSTIERCFKKVIADRLESLAPIMSDYIMKEIRKSSANPRYDKMHGFLAKYKRTWADEFKVEVNRRSDVARLMSSLESLVNNRNTFAHNGSCACAFDDIGNYFVDATEFIIIMDEVVYRP